MTETGEALAGSGRYYRLDPHSLPLCGSSDRAACESFYIDHDRVVLRHATAKGPRTTTVPVSGYDGVSVRIDAESDPAQLLVELAHADRSLNVPLARSAVPEDIADDWQDWGRILRLPLMVMMPDGTVTRYTRTEEAADATPARRKGAILADRRPRFLSRRRIGVTGNVIQVDFREIIARS